MMLPKKRSLKRRSPPRSRTKMKKTSPHQPPRSAAVPPRSKLQRTMKMKRLLRLRRKLALMARARRPQSLRTRAKRRLQHPRKPGPKRRHLRRKWSKSRKPKQKTKLHRLKRLVAGSLLPRNPRPKMAVRLRRRRPSLRKCRRRGMPD